MAPKGKPRDMTKWQETLRDPNITFPGESSEYRGARNQLLKAEDELRRLNEEVAAQRRALPAGGLVAEDYVFESAADGSMVRFSELFTPGKDALVIYHMMFPRWSKDERAGASMGKTALLPLVEQPCPSCTSVVDGLNGPAAHLADNDAIGAHAQGCFEKLLGANAGFAEFAAYGDEAQRVRMIEPQFRHVLDGDHLAARRLKQGAGVAAAAERGVDEHFPVARRERRQRFGQQNRGVGHFLGPLLAATHADSDARASAARLSF